MTYTSDIPQSGETLGATRARINANFQEIATVEAVNHVAFNAAGEGKHKFLQMPEQASAPTTAANEVGFYAKVGTNPAQSNLFLRGESDGFEYQITKTISASTASFGEAGGATGWTFLPGNLILQWGNGTSVGSTATTHNFPIAFTVAPYSVVLTSIISSSTADATLNAAPSTTQFTVRGKASGNHTFYWVAIGR